MQEFFHILKHTFEDSLSVFLIAFVIYVIISFIEQKIAQCLNFKNRFSPMIASGLGLIPQCGLTIIGSDLYLKKHITLGTLIALFLACSDESIPILLASNKQGAIFTVISIVITKFIIGMVAGYIIDLFKKDDKKAVSEHLHECHEDLKEITHTGCCEHTIEGDHQYSIITDHLLHPLKHTIKIFIYVFIINLIFNSLIEFIGHDILTNFLASNKYLAPLFSALIGVIPNCASSVVITNLYLLNGLSFGACISGLCMNAGLGLVFLFKKKTSIKDGFLILGLMLGISLIAGYLICIIIGF